MIMRLMDILLAIPGLLLAIGIVALDFRSRGSTRSWSRSGDEHSIFALLRGSILAQRENDFVLAARAVGARP
jgi:peptide/nickel transport system permease protein